jgi:NADH-quinone oxidoreductase subunit N
MPTDFQMPPASDLIPLLPQLLVAGLAMLVLLADAISPKMSKSALANISVAGLVVALVIQLAQKASPNVLLANMVVADQYANFFNSVFLVGAILSVLLSVDYLEREGISHGEYYALLLLTTAGMMIMAAATDLIIVFLGLEVLSISLYILAGYARDRLTSEEAALKYFLLGAFASAFFLYGVALIYGATQSTNLLKIASQVASGGAVHSPLLIAGAALLVVGFGFKVAVVPFHIWTPDVYEGAPTSVTAFMSVGAKAAGFAAFLRVFSMALPGLGPESARVVALLAALTMVVGNFVAVAQRNIKRLLAYSSIAHAGYMMVGMAAAIHPLNDANRNEAIASVLFYTLAYTVTNLGAFAVVMAFRREGAEVLELDEYAGLGLKYPALGAAMTLFMISLAGLPPTVGFIGKFYLFRAALTAGFTGLVIVGVLTSVVSVYYYLAVIVRMYMVVPEPAAEGEAPRTATALPGGHLTLGLGLTALATLLLGIFPGSVLAQAQDAWQAFSQAVARL